MLQSKVNMKHPRNFSRKFFSLSLCCLTLNILPQVCFAEEGATSPHEALLLKRIVEYWKDEDYTLAKRQILDFLNQYEGSAFKDHLMAMLGDLNFNEENYSEAIQNYTQISAEEFKEKTYLKHLKALFELREYGVVEKMAASRVSKENNAESGEAIQITLLYADALYRQNKVVDALPYFEALSQTTYQDFCLLPLAEGYRKLEDYPKAVTFYRTMLEKRADKKEDILFQIATLESEYDKSAAAKTFYEVATLSGEKEGIASYNHLTLLYDLNEYEALLSAADTLMEKIPHSELSVARYYVGSSHFSLKNYERAIPALEAFVLAESEATPRLKSALLNLILCARETEDEALSEKVLGQLAINFANDPAYLQSFLVNAQIQKEAGGISLKTDEIRKLLSLSGDFEGREKILYDVALLLLEEESWESGREILQLFLNEYPQSKNRSFAFRHLLNTSIEALKTSPDSSDYKELFVSDLQKIFAEGRVLTVDEEQEYRLSFAKTLYELNRPLEALKETEDFLSHYPGDPRAYDAHLMAALYIKEGEGDFVKAALHLERSLFLNPDQTDSHLVHLQLYNAYLTLSAQDKEKKETFLDQASDHLFESFMKQKESVLFDNQIWLANHYYSKVKKHSEAHKNVFSEGFLPLKRSIATYEKILGFEEGIVAFPKDNDLLLLEGEALKYADLLSRKKDLPKKIALLEILTRLTSEKPEMEWKHQNNSLFELAKSYEMQEEAHQAIALYERLLEGHSPSYLTHAAQLQKTRLQFALLPAEEREESSPAVIDILNQLKDLQIKKQLHCEPVHFEAALEYVSVRVALTEEASKLDKNLFYLKRVKEDFLADDDIIGQEYFEARKKFPEKERLFTLYMNYVDAEMLRLQGEKAKSSGKKDEASTLLTKASEQLEELLNQSKDLTPFLKDKIQQSRAALE